MPESEKLIAISDFFGVSLDYLLKDDESAPENDGCRETGKKETEGFALWILGIVTCIGGVLCLIVWGILSVLDSSASDKIGESSAITIDGNGIFLIFCVVAIVIGAILLLKGAKKK